jgi:hypothetical protein
MAQRTTGRGAHPYSLRNTIQNPLSRMLPLSREQSQVYRLGERLPPSAGMSQHGPDWEVVNLVLTAQSTLQARIPLQRDYYLLALNASTTSNANGGFLAQLYDVKKQVRLALQGIQFPNFGGTQGPAGPVGPFYLRDPYHFDEPDSQILVMVQSLELVTTTVQLVLYGVALPFNAPSGNEFPGGPVSSVSTLTARGGKSQ